MDGEIFHFSKLKCKMHPALMTFRENGEDKEGDERKT